MSAMASASAAKAMPAECNSDEGSSASNLRSAFSRSASNASSCSADSGPGIFARHLPGPGDSCSVCSGASGRSDSDLEAGFCDDNTDAKHSSECCAEKESLTGQINAGAYDSLISPRNVKVGSSSVASARQPSPRKSSRLEPRPLYYNPDALDELGEEWKKVARTGNGVRLITPSPKHEGHVPPPEPIGKSLKFKSASGKCDSSAHAATAEQLLAHDRAVRGSAFTRVTAYMRQDVRIKGAPKDDQSQVAAAGAEAGIPPYEAVDATADTLRFESRFESGNLEAATQVAPYEYELTMSVDFNTRSHTQWFYFAITNMKRGNKYKLNITNFYKTDSLYNWGLRPLVYSEARAKRGDGVGWHRAGQDICYYQSDRQRGVARPQLADAKTPEAKGSQASKASPLRRTPAKFYYTLTFTIECPQHHEPTDLLYVAHCYPWTYSNMVEHMDALAADPDKASKLRRRKLCLTEAGNVCEVLTITAPVKTPDEMKERRTIALSARVHPGETNSSWMMKGVLDFLLGSSPEAAQLLQAHVFKIVPMLNPDGVILGNYRCGLSGNDLNRRWKNPSPEAHPTVYHWRALLQRLSSERPVVCFLDLHGHSRKSNVFCYGCETRYWNVEEEAMTPRSRQARTGDHRMRPHIERVLPSVLSMTSPIFDLRSCNYHVGKRKEGCSRVVAWRRLTRSAFTIEASFRGPDFGPLKDLHLNTQHLQDFGRHLCLALHQVFEPPPPPPPPRSSSSSSARAAPTALGSRAQEMHDRIHRMMALRDELDKHKKSGAAAATLPAAADLSEEDRSLMLGIAGSLSDDDDSSDDDAILDPRKLKSHLAKGKPPALKKKPRAISLADRTSTPPTPPVKSPTVRTPKQSLPLVAQVSSKGRGDDAGAASSKTEEQGRHKVHGEDASDKDEAAARLQELLSNADQMRAVAKARSAMHPPTCTCLLCRAPALLDAGDVLLAKMKPGHPMTVIGKGGGAASGPAAATPAPGRSLVLPPASAKLPATSPVPLTEFKPAATGEWRDHLNHNPKRTATEKMLRTAGRVAIERDAAAAYQDPREEGERIPSVSATRRLGRGGGFVSKSALSRSGDRDNRDVSGPDTGLLSLGFKDGPQGGLKEAAKAGAAAGPRGKETLTPAPRLVDSCLSPELTSQEPVKAWPAGQGARRALHGQRPMTIAGASPRGLYAERVLQDVGASGGQLGRTGVAFAGAGGVLAAKMPALAGGSLTSHLSAQDKKPAKPLFEPKVAKVRRGLATAGVPCMFEEASGGGTGEGTAAQSREQAVCVVEPSSGPEKSRLKSPMTAITLASRRMLQDSTKSQDSPKSRRKPR